MKLDARHHEAIAMMLAGASRQEIATKLGVHPTLVYQWTKHPEFAAALENARKELQQRVTAMVTDRLAEEAPKSLERLVQLRDTARSERVQLIASQDLLDRAGFKAVERVHELHEHILSPEFAELLKRVLSEERTIVVDADASGVTELPERTRLS
jgi:transposase